GLSSRLLLADPKYRSCHCKKDQYKNGGGIRPAIVAAVGVFAHVLFLSSTLPAEQLRPTLQGPPLPAVQIPKKHHLVLNIFPNITFAHNQELVSCRPSLTGCAAVRATSCRQDPPCTFMTSTTNTSSKTAYISSAIRFAAT